MQDFPPTKDGLPAHPMARLISLPLAVHTHIRAHRDTRCIAEAVIQYDMSIHLAGRGSDYLQ